MWDRLLKSWRRTAGAEATAQLEPDAVLWAVGDIHGRADLLAPLLDHVEADLGKARAARRLFVGLGDYVDRGPDSRGVLDLLVAFEARSDIECHYLRGNHELFFERFMADPDVGPKWCEHGGRATLASYGVAPPASNLDMNVWAEASVRMKEALPPRHRALLEGLELSFVCGDYFCAHAGARPGVPLSDQSPDDLMWIRNDFIESREPFEKVVVHGHTPSPAYHMDARRIGLDTGAYATGVLSAMRFERDVRELLVIKAVGAQIVSERSQVTASSTR